MVASLLVLVIADFVLTGHMFGVATGDLGEHDIGPFVAATIVLTDLALDVVVWEHRVVQCDARLRGMALALGLVRFVEAGDLLLTIHVADVDHALVYRTRLPLHLDHTRIRIVSCLDYGLADPTSQLLLASSLAT